MGGHYSYRAAVPKLRPAVPYRYVRHLVPDHTEMAFYFEMLTGFCVFHPTTDARLLLYLENNTFRAAYITFLFVVTARCALKGRSLKIPRRQKKKSSEKRLKHTTFGLFYSIRTGQEQHSSPKLHDAALPETCAVAGKSSSGLKSEEERARERGRKTKKKPKTTQAKFRFSWSGNAKMFLKVPSKPKP